MATLQQVYIQWVAVEQVYIQWGAVEQRSKGH